MAQALAPPDAYQQAFMERMNKSRQTSEGGGLGFFRGDLDVKFWKCLEGDHDMDIIPYLAGPNDPDTKEGGITYLLEVYQHRDVGGVEGQVFICMEATYIKGTVLPDGTPAKGSCPICLHRQQLVKEGADEALIKALRPGRYPRSIYNVVVYDSDAEQAKGVQVFHTSHWLMEQYLGKLSLSSRHEIEQGLPPQKYFAHPETGNSIRFTRAGQRENTRYYGHQLVDRNYAIPQATLDNAHVLDTLVHLPTFDEVYTAYWGVAPEAGQTGGPVAAAVVVGGAAGAPSLTRGDPLPAAGGAAPAPDAAVVSNAVATGVPACPAGGVFGVNSYELAHCEKCVLWQSCVAENERLLAAAGGAAGGNAAAPTTGGGPPATGAPAPAPGAGGPPAPGAGAPAPGGRTMVGTGGPAAGGRGGPAPSGSGPTVGGRGAPATTSPPVVGGGMPGSRKLVS